jgi:hypothetical protein
MRGIRPMSWPHVTAPWRGLALSVPTQGDPRFDLVEKVMRDCGLYAFA